MRKFTFQIDVKSTHRAEITVHEKDMDEARELALAIARRNVNPVANGNVEFVGMYDPGVDYVKLVDEKEELNWDQ